MCTSRKYPYSPHRRDWNFLGDEGFCKTQKFKEMCEALLEFPGMGGGGGLRKNPFRKRGLDMFWNYTVEKMPDILYHKYNCIQDTLSYNLMQ